MHLSSGKGMPAGSLVPGDAHVTRCALSLRLTPALLNVRNVTKAASKRGPARPAGLAQAMHPKRISIERG